MTFDDDHMQFAMLSGPPKIVTLKSVGLTWPPPAALSYHDFPFRRVRMSMISDEQRQHMTHVCRGAEYEPVEVPPATLR